MKPLARRNENYLTSKIVLAARLKSRISAIRSALDFYPNIRLIGEGSSLVYTLNGNETGDHFYSIELARDRISLTIHSKQTPIFFIQEAILRLLSIIQMVAGHYELEVSSLYPYLILSLAAQQTSRLLHSKGESDRGPDGTDLVLSKRVISLSKENRKMRESLMRAMEKLHGITLKAVAVAGLGDPSIESVARALGLEKAEVLSALADMREIGYKTVYSNNDKFSLIKL